MQKVFIASDHGGFKAKEFAKICLNELKFDVTDLGTFSEESCDYPDYANLLALNLKQNPNALGILVCGTGIGISIAANRYNHIRCALCHDENTAKLAKEHNNANVLAFGGRILDQNTIKNIIKTFFVSKFEGGRHEKRLKKLGECNAVC
nr:ribose 5-phosphate isomerase B [Campylobacter sp.]